jgi:Ca-activated chloride channel homolog
MGSMNNYFFRFATPYALLLLFAVPCIIFLRSRKRVLRYFYPPTHLLAAADMGRGTIYRIFLKILRIIASVLLIIVCARPQWVDEQSKIEVQGIDIMLVLDVSGSMDLPYDAKNQRSRFEVAKDEACRFIKKRCNDAIGLVLFGNEVISRSPLTMDKTMLLDMVNSLRLGEVDYNGTKLATSMVTGVNRLKDSKAASKIMIVLTDGQPSAGDTEPKVPVEIAKKYGIKIYTIGIGSEYAEVIGHPLYGWVHSSAINRPLLESIALHTGGRCFIAHNPQDMREIYDSIDQLEKTKLEMPLFAEYYDMYVPVLCAALVLLSAEVLLSTFMWFSV